jgi:glycosyltransferase involved in cell wall biosynthesis
MTVRLSVMIPSYKSAGFLPACVESIRAAGEASVEIIVVDDGSPDNTREVAEKLGVTYLYQHNQRQAVARNTGLKVATGQYWAFLDADDTWKPGILPRMLELMDRRPDLAVVHTDAEMGNPEQGYVSLQENITKTLPAFWKLPHELDDGFRVFEPVAHRKLLMTRNLAFMGASVMRAEMFRRTRGFAPRATNAEDWEICMQLSAFGGFAYHPQPLAVYFRHENNVSNNKERMIYAFCEARRAMLEHTTGLPEDLVQKLREGLKMESAFYADLAYGRGDYSEARRRYRQNRAEFGLSKSARLSLLLSNLPAPLTNLIRRLR